jgi:predicted RNA binding protein YcfA (HicA-like mRNA interferase family)
VPRKIRQLKADLRRAGFIEDSNRGRGSHSHWRHPQVPGVKVVLSGHDGADARAYHESEVRDAIVRAMEALDQGSME